jgi:predicted ATPase/DNA-binding SARP family transcriptional activator
MEFRVLGPLEVADGETPVVLGGGKQRALLAVLLLNAGRPVAVERLIDELWGAAVPATAAKMVQIYVSQLRKRLPAGTLRTRPPGYSIELGEDELDLDRAERLIAEGKDALREGEPARAAARLRQALALWRGSALAEFPEPFAAVEGRRLEELRLAAMEERVEADLALGEHTGLVGELEVLVARNPLRERLRRQQMLALYRCGRQAEALAAYTDARRILDAELGLEPSGALRDLERRILRQDPALDPVAAPPSAAPAAAAAPPPSGTITFLLTDIEGSAPLLERLGPAWGATLDAHRELLRSTIEGAAGQQVSASGEAVFAVFARPPDAVVAAASAQRALAAADWPEGVRVRVRMGLHTGAVERAGQDYAGPDVHRAACICAAAHGGQVLLSSATRALTERSLPEDLRLRDLGEHRLKDLAQPERLHQLSVDGLVAEFPPPLALDAWRQALPAPPTTFIGRERETAEILDLLERTGLLTLTGPGGTGKTRLALRVAAESAEAYGDRAVFVALGALEDPSLVASTVAAAVGVQEEVGRPILTSLTDRLGRMEILLVLDNYEHVLAAAPLVGELVAAGPGVRVLVTSRAPLRLAGEREYHVRPLTLPDPSTAESPDELAGSEAVALFVDRARAIDPGFALEPGNAAAVAAICSALDGVPLAIELAAARVRLLSPQTILVRLREGLSLLTGGPRDLPERQRTLRDSIQWSHDLLDPAGQTLFRRLAVFAGGWSLEAADAVCSPAGSPGLDVLETLNALVLHSLVRRDDTAPEPRFRMLQTIREFGLERLAASGEEPEIRERHAQFFLTLAEEAAGELSGPGHVAWLDRLTRDHDNLRGALRWSVDADRAETGLLIAAALWRFWQLRDHLAEGEAWLTALLAAPSAAASTPARAAGTKALASVVYWRGHPLFRGSGTSADSEGLG